MTVVNAMCRHRPTTGTKHSSCGNAGTCRSSVSRTRSLPAREPCCSNTSPKSSSGCVPTACRRRTCSRCSRPAGDVDRRRRRLHRVLDAPTGVRTGDPADRGDRTGHDPRSRNCAADWSPANARQWPRPRSAESPSPTAPRLPQTLSSMAVAGGRPYQRGWPSSASMCPTTCRTVVRCTSPATTGFSRTRRRCRSSESWDYARRSPTSPSSGFPGDKGTFGLAAFARPDDR